MNKTIILLTVSFAMFMEAIDTTIINTAIPVMAEALKVNPIDLKIALISYLLSLAIFIPISGWVADKFGVKKVFIFALLIFTLSSLWCGLTNSLYELIIARVVQGLGGSLTMPVGRLIIVRTCERHELVSKMSLVVMVASLGMMLGPLLGGVITHHISWRWIFWVNIPPGLLAMFLAKKYLPKMPPCPVGPLDLIGFVLFGSGLAILTFGLSLLSESNVSTTFILSIFLTSIVLLVSYVFHSHKRSNAIIKVDLLTSRTFFISVTGNLLTRLSFGGTPFLLPLLFQIGLGYSSQLSGILLAPIALGVLLVKPLSVSILRHLGYKNLLVFNTLLVSFSLWSFCLISKNMSIYSIGLLTFIYGFLISLQYTGMNSLAYAQVEDQDISSATSIMSTVQQLAQSFGVAVSALLLSFFSNNHLFTVKVFHETFMMLGLLTVLSAGIFFFLKKNDGEELIK